MQGGPHLGPQLSAVTTPIVWFTSGTDTIPLRIVVMLKRSSPLNCVVTLEGLLAPCQCDHEAIEGWLRRSEELGLG